MTTQPELVHTLTNMATPFAASLGIALWGIEVAFGPQSLIRIYVESEEGVTIDQCADLSRLLGLSLEVEDILPGPYTLEVSSPGLERIFFTAEQLAGALGKRVEVTLLLPAAGFPGRKKFLGTLTGAKGEQFSLTADDVARPGETPPVVTFSFEQIRKAKLLLALPEKTLPGKKGGAKKTARPVATEAEPGTDDL